MIRTKKNTEKSVIYDYGMLLLPEVNPQRKFILNCENTYFQKLWNIALDDIEKSRNTVTEFGVVYSAGAYGKDFSSLVFCRDNVYSGLLSLNLLYPKEMLEAYKAIRQVRYRLGFSCFKQCGCILDGIEGIKVYPLGVKEFFEKFQKASAINKTDDVVWIWGYYDLLKKHDYGIEEWKWMYENAVYGFDNLYKPFYDNSDGLYFGQPTFIDVGGSGYPNGFNQIDRKSRNRCVWVKASSTNSLYYKAMCILSEVADMLELHKEAEEWSIRAEKLKSSMLKKMRFSNGTFTYFLHKDGKKEERRDVLGSAFPVLCGVVKGNDARNALTAYPVTPYGIPLLFPFYQRDDRYHNNSMWPFADTFFLLAYEKAFEVSALELNMQILLNSFTGGHFRELRDVSTNLPAGSYAQLWTTSAFLNVMIRSGFTEFKSSENNLN